MVGWRRVERRLFIAHLSHVMCGLRGLGCVVVPAVWGAGLPCDDPAEARRGLGGILAGSLTAWVAAACPCRWNLCGSTGQDSVGLQESRAYGCWTGSRNSSRSVPAYRPPSGFRPRPSGVAHCAGAYTCGLVAPPWVRSGANAGHGPPIAGGAARRLFGEPGGGPVGRIDCWKSGRAAAGTVRCPRRRPSPHAEPERIRQSGKTRQRCRFNDRCGPIRRTTGG